MPAPEHVKLYLAYYFYLGCWKPSAFGIFWFHHAPCGFDSPPLQSKLNQPPTDSSLISLSLPAMHCTLSSLFLFYSPQCFPVFHLQSMLTPLFPLSRHLSRRRSSPSFFSPPLLCFKPARFSSLISRPDFLAFLFFFFPLHQPCCAFSTPSTPQNPPNGSHVSRIPEQTTQLHCGFVSVSASTSLSSTFEKKKKNE